MRIFLASGNQKKILEMQRILGEQVPDLEVLGIDDVDGYVEPVEDQPTFEGNALLKARAGVAATGLPTVADDSGLCVAALNGMPGVLSARWSGPPLGDKRGADARNNDLLLAQLSDVPDERRDAYFTCAIAWVMPDGRERVVEGRMDGRVLREVRGSGGFGYDVLFVADEHAEEGLTSAELDPAEKDRISHRGRALRELAPLVAGDLSDG
ncbi:RdgB/HAM1 family non-canonical purine NTP pyrophosphatase [Nocardioides oleivorans]|uniref:dITP/XTP pyrophosphatase n=1 Tax=Nocardioides oleivorans TaxID=273676 RepID=A0A4Q2S415_9ACTN|nr:RdgB/HAM1 family non-canonical purine NTP pyrophosphatase [Nocardioides oleivorans]RYB95194.1 RdgB/HAM1 family non-canonical purine NTP pyrophosphatase [Nocardioides oleivorans]